MAYTKSVILTRNEITLLNKARAVVAAQRALRKARARQGVTAERIARAEDRCFEAAGALDTQMLAMALENHA